VTEAMDPRLQVAVQRSSATAVVSVAGELDLASVPELAELLRDLEPPFDRVVLDLSELAFMDSTGLTLAITEHRRAEMDGFEFLLAGASGPVLRALRLAGLDAKLKMVPDVASALADGTGPTPDPPSAS
jgi:anti-sigma B factor antagonist